MDKEVLVLGDDDAWHHSLDQYGLGRDAMWHCVARNVLGVPHLVCQVPALSQRTCHWDWRTASVGVGRGVLFLIPRGEGASLEGISGRYWTEILQHFTKGSAKMIDL